VHDLRRARQGHASLTLDEEQSRPFIRKALELGINFFDTANSYSDGASEEIVGRALRDFAQRDEVVIATKVFFYELRLVARIAALGWPVAPAVAGPIELAGHVWSLAPFLPGDPSSEKYWLPNSVRADGSWLRSTPTWRSSVGLGNVARGGDLMRSLATRRWTVS
jgi:hypothetical protein